MFLKSKILSNGTFFKVFIIITLSAFINCLLGKSLFAATIEFRQTGSPTIVANGTGPGGDILWKDLKSLVIPDWTLVNLAPVGPGGDNTLIVDVQDNAAGLQDLLILTDLQLNRTGNSPVDIIIKHTYTTSPVTSTIQKLVASISATGSYNSPNAGNLEVSGNYQKNPSSSSRGLLIGNLEINSLSNSGITPFTLGPESISLIGSQITTGSYRFEMQLDPNVAGTGSFLRLPGSIIGKTVESTPEPSNINSFIFILIFGSIFIIKDRIYN